MLKLSVSDLIRRAAQLADLENSDFISWNENVMAVNEAYGKIYQKAINKDDKYYMKECLLEPGTSLDGRACYTLPCDFYQLYAVNTYPENKCIIRQSINAPINTSGYDIVNDELIIYGAFTKLIKVRYYPVPKTLVYAGKDVQLTLPDLSKVSVVNMDVYNKNVVWLTDSLSVQNKMLHYYNLDEGIEKIKNVRIAEDLNKIKVIACKDGVVTCFNSSMSPRTYYIKYEDINGEGTEFQPIQRRYVFLSKDKEPLYYNDNTQCFETLEGLQYVKVGPNGVNLLNNVQTQYERYLIGSIDNETQKCYFTAVRLDNIDISGETWVYDYLSDSFEQIPNAVSNIKYILTNGGTTLYITSGGIVNDFENTFTYGSGLIGINKIDGNTGYGVTTKTGVIKSVFKDTLVEYPNNLFIQLVAYQLAMMYKSKQGGDVSSLAVLYQEAESQFYDTLSRDDYGSTRIQNVY